MHSYSGEAMRMPILCPQVTKFIVAHELHQIIHYLFRGCLHSLRITYLHAEKTDACICIVWINCELMKTLLGCLDLFVFCFDSVTDASCILLSNSEELGVCQRQLLVSASLHVDQCEIPDVL